MDATSPPRPCALNSDREERNASGNGLESLAILLAVGSAAYLAVKNAASAKDLQDGLQHFHPLAADLNQLAESVRLCHASAHVVTPACKSFAV